MASYDRNNYFSKKVTLLNVAATILIVLIHSETPLRFGQPLELSTYLFIYCVLKLADVAVPLFFFISALLFYRDCDWRDIPKKLYRRIFSLVIPFILWNLIFVAIYYALRKIPFTAERMNLVNSLDTVKDWILAIWHTKYTPLWFIKYLVFFNILSPLVLMVIKNRWVGLIVVCVLLVAGYIYGWDSFTLRYWSPIYISGALAGRYLYEPGRNDSAPLLESRSNWAKSVAIAAFLILLILNIICDGFIYWFKFFGPVLIWYGADIIASKYIGERMEVNFWMGCTFFIYATHQFVLNVEQTLVRSFLPGTPMVLNLTFIITPIVTIVFLAFIARLLCGNRVYQILTGGR